MLKRSPDRRRQAITAFFIHYSEVEPAFWYWPNFTPREMADRITGALLIDIQFMDWLQEIRLAHGQPMIITSGYRSPLHQEEISERRTGAHVDAMAVDVLTSAGKAHEIAKIAFAHGVLGIGVHQKGPHGQRYLHLDRWFNAPEGLRPTIWSY